MMMRLQRMIQAQNNVSTEDDTKLRIMLLQMMR